MSTLQCLYHVWGVEWRFGSSLERGGEWKRTTSGGGALGTFEGRIWGRVVVWSRFATDHIRAWGGGQVDLCSTCLWSGSAFWPLVSVANLSHHGTFTAVSLWYYAMRPSAFANPTEFLRALVLLANGSMIHRVCTIWFRLTHLTELACTLLRLQLQELFYNFPLLVSQGICKLMSLVNIFQRQCQWWMIKFLQEDSMSR